MGEIEDVLGELQMHNQQLQTIMIQKQAIMIQDKEMEKALEEVDKCTGEDIFKSMGPILVKTTRESIKKELEEGREDNDLKLKSLEKQETRVKQKIKTIQEKFQSMAKLGEGG